MLAASPPAPGVARALLPATKRAGGGQGGVSAQVACAPLPRGARSSASESGDQETAAGGTRGVTQPRALR